jgi:hypothetical protein
MSAALNATNANAVRAVCKPSLGARSSEWSHGGRKCPRVWLTVGAMLNGLGLRSNRQIAGLDDRLSDRS